MAYDYNETYGNYIIVQHKENISTLYARLSEVKVIQGDKIKQGDIIGLTVGYSVVTYEVVDGRMPCALAIIKS